VLDSSTAFRARAPSYNYTFLCILFINIFALMDQIITFARAIAIVIDRIFILILLFIYTVGKGLAWAMKFPVPLIS
jgi:hypothetical protein